MTGFEYEQQLTAAKEAASKLKPKLEQIILGKRLAAWSCNCGAISQPESEAIAVVPGGSEKRYEGQVGSWMQWTVSMRNVDKTGNYNYAIGISEFIPMKKIEAMFNEAFKGIDVKTLEIESYKRNR